METQPLPKPEPESTVIESLLKIKQLFSKNKTENEISDKLSSKFKKLFKAKYQKYKHKPKHLPFNILSLSKAFIDVFDNEFYSQKYLKDISHIIYRLFKLSSTKEESSLILSHLFTFLTKTNTKETTLRKYILKLMNDKLISKFPKNYYQEVISSINDHHLQNKILLHLVCNALNSECKKTQLLKIYNMIYMFIIGINKEYLDKIVLLVTCDMLLLHLSLFILQKDISNQIVSELVNMIKSIFSIIEDNCLFVDFRMKLLFILQCIYNKKVNNNNNNDKDSITVFKNIDNNIFLLLNMISIDNYYNEIKTFLIEKSISSKNNTLYLNNTYGIISYNFLFKFNDNTDLTAILNQDVFEVEIEINNKHNKILQLTFEDGLYCKLLHTITSTMQSETFKKCNLKLQNKQLYILRILSFIIQIKNDLTLNKQLYTLMILQQIIEHSQNDFLIEWDMIFDIIESFLPNSKHLQHEYQNILNTIFILQNEHLKLINENRLADLLFEFDFPNDTNYLILKLNYISSCNFEIINKHFSKFILFYNNELFANIHTLPKDTLKPRCDYYLMFFNKIKPYLQRLQFEQNNAKALEDLVIQRYPYLFKYKEIIDSCKLILLTSNNIDFAGTFIELLITKYHSHSFCIPLINEFILYLSNEHEIKKLQCIFTTITNIVMQFKQQKKYSLINTFCVFIENYSLNERSLLVFENTLLPIIINNNELHNTTSYAVFNIHYIIEYLLEDLTQNDNASEIITICKRCNSLLENNIGLLKGINIISFINNFKTLLLSELKPSGIAFKFVIRCLYKLAFHLDYEGNGSQYSLYFKTKGSTLQQQQRNIKHEIMKTIQEQFEIKIKNIINIINKESELKSKVKGNQNLKQSQFEQGLTSITTEELNIINSLFQNAFLLFSCMNIYLYSLYDTSKQLHNKPHIHSIKVQELLDNLIKDFSQIVEQQILISTDDINKFRFMLLIFLSYNYKLIAQYSSFVIHLFYFILSITWPSQLEHIHKAFVKEFPGINFNTITNKFTQSDNMVFELTCDYYLVQMVYEHKMMLRLYTAVKEGLKLQNGNYEIVNDNNSGDVVNKEEFMLLRKQVFLDMLKWGMMSRENSGNVSMNDNDGLYKTDWKRTKTYLEINNKKVMINCDKQDLKQNKIKVLIRSELANREFTLIKNVSQHTEEEEQQQQQQQELNDEESNKQLQTIINALNNNNNNNDKIQTNNNNNNERIYKTKIIQKEQNINDINYITNHLQRLNHFANFDELSSNHLLSQFNSFSLSKTYTSQVYYYSPPTTLNTTSNNSLNTFLSLLGTKTDDSSYTYTGTHLTILFTYSNNTNTIPYHEGCTSVSLLYITSPFLSTEDNEAITRITFKDNGYLIKILPITSTYYNVSICGAPNNVDSFPEECCSLLMNSTIHIDQLADYIRTNIILINTSILLYNTNTNTTYNNNNIIYGVYSRYKCLSQMTTVSNNK